MSVIRNVALVVLAISSTTFIALFGRLPIFRKTPIGFLHRLIWNKIPAFFRGVDARLTGGRLTRALARTMHYLFHDKHPLVLIFFLLLLGVSEAMFIPGAWSHLSLLHRILCLSLSTIVYVFLYLGSTKSAYITPANHAQHMRLYPYDRALFHPGYRCRTCHFLKPARSKHCSICKACIAKADHHCIWLNNCVGRNNYVYFIALLFWLSILLAYGMCLGFSTLDGILQERLVLRFTRGSITSKHWAQRLDWPSYFQLWAMAVAEYVRIGAVTLLSALSFPLTTGLFLYHVYLVWAGTTTNETCKWADWRDDIADGVVFKAKRTEVIDDQHRDEEIEPNVEWPISSDQFLVRTEDGKPPRFRREGETGAANEDGEYDPRWKKVESLKDVDNIYDLGFLDNALEIIRGT